MQAANRSYPDHKNGNFLNVGQGEAMHRITRLKLGAGQN